VAAAATVAAPGVVVAGVAVAVFVRVALRDGVLSGCLGLGLDLGPPLLPPLPFSLLPLPLLAAGSACLPRAVEPAVLLAGVLVFGDGDSNDRGVALALLFEASPTGIDGVAGSAAVAAARGSGDACGVVPTDQPKEPKHRQRVDHKTD
jgi:hypothetical protein